MNNKKSNKYAATWYPYDTTMAISALKQTMVQTERDGFSYFEIVPPASLIALYKKECSLFKKRKLQFTIHFEYLDTNLASKNKGIQEETVRQFLKTIDFAAAIRAKTVVFHPGWYYPEEKKSDALKRLKKQLPLLLKKAKEKNIVLAVENMEEKENQLCTTKEEIKELVDQFPELQVCFDVAHFLYRYKNLRRIEEAWQCLKDRVVEVHLSGIKKTIPHYKVNLGENEININSFLKKLQDFRGVIKFENISYEDIVISKEFLERVMFS